MTPESPPLARMMIARTPIAITVAAPRINCTRVESRMSKNANTIRPPSRIRKHWNQPGLQPVCAARSVDIVTPPIASTNEMPTAKAVP